MKNGFDVRRSARWDRPSLPIDWAEVERDRVRALKLGGEYLDAFERWRVNQKTRVGAPDVHERRLEERLAYAVGRINKYITRGLFRHGVWK